MNTTSNKTKDSRQANILKYKVYFASTAFHLKFCLPPLSFHHFDETPED